MTTKSQLLAKIKELQAQYDAMPDDKLNPVFVPNEDTYWCVQVGGKWSGLTDFGYSEHQNASFRTQEAAEAYGEAFQTILELHALSDWDRGGQLCVVNYVGGVEVQHWVISSTNHIFGRFASKESAQAAIDKVGKKRIEKAFDVLARGNV